MLLIEHYFALLFVSSNNVSIRSSSTSAVRPLPACEIFLTACGGNTATYSQARSWILNQDYWTQENMHFLDLINYIRDMYAYDTGEWYEDILDIPCFHPIRLLKQWFDAASAAWDRMTGMYSPNGENCAAGQY